MTSLSESSRREVDGGVQLPGALLGDASHTPNSNSVAVSPLTSRRRRFNSRPKNGEPFIDDRELLAGLLFFLIPLAAAFVVLATAFIYAAFVA